MARRTAPATCKCPPGVLARGNHMPGCPDGPPPPPVFDPANAPIEDFTCSWTHPGGDVPVTFIDELIPSGMHHKVICPDGHVTNGIPVARYRVSS